jgi:branched-subunit amino acid aminotransferase/4-amino-4-deoxychorismate lyase
MAMDFHLETKMIADCIEELLTAEDISEARIRLSVSAGDTQARDGGAIDRACTTLISAAPFVAYPPSLYENGMTVLVSSYRQNPRMPSTGHKTLSYVDRLLALRQAQVAGAGEALWLTAAENALAEGCVSNVFIVTTDGCVYTPPCQYPADTAFRMSLPGITRNVLITSVNKQDIKIQEKMLFIEDLLTASEVFLTNAIMGVMPVSRIERHAVGTEKPGPVTRKLAQMYDQYVTEQFDATRPNQKRA